MTCDFCSAAVPANKGHPWACCSGFWERESPWRLLQGAGEKHWGAASSRRLLSGLQPLSQRVMNSPARMGQTPQSSLV